MISGFLKPEPSGTVHTPMIPSDPNLLYRKSYIAVDKRKSSSNQESRNPSSQGARRTRSSALGINVGSTMRTWREISEVNYMSCSEVTDLKSQTTRSNASLQHEQYEARHPPEEEEVKELFPKHVTPLMNEDQHWGCFYNFPQHYDDAYSPTVRVRRLESVPPLVSGVLTRDMIAACLSYLKRTPILGDFVFIKLDLSAKHITNIEVLQHYRYLVYLDLSSNLLTELHVLSHLLYLQYLNVSFNRLDSVLDYNPPQWFLTEVHYKFNSVKRIKDLSLFWSITVLDLSHNNIKHISGLETLNYLRRLDLSFNHIQRLENLNHLRLLWLDVSYNNISSFEYGATVGLWTLLYMEYLNLNENKLTSMKMFAGCTRLRELHARNNQFSILLELAVYMRQMKRLDVLDLRENPICSALGYREVVISTFPLLLNLDANEVDPVEQCLHKMKISPNVVAFATRRLLRLLYIEQLKMSKVSQFTPPGDTTEVPLVIIVGCEAIGKGTLVRRLAKECSSHVELAVRHTTCTTHFPGHYIEVSRKKFDEMILAGEFLTYSEVDGESYGLSREQAFIKGGKVKIISMELIPALMMTLRGRRPYLILATRSDKQDMHLKRANRKAHRIDAYLKNTMQHPADVSTLRVMISSRILITGLLNEILMSIGEDSREGAFLIPSQCSLMMDSDERMLQQDRIRERINLYTLLSSSTASLEEACHQALREMQEGATERSLCSLYKESHCSEEDTNAGSQTSATKKPQSEKKHSTSIVSQRHSKTEDSATAPDSAKSSKSVTFVSLEDTTDAPDELSGLFILPRASQMTPDKPPALGSLSGNTPFLAHATDSRGRDRLSTMPSLEDLDFWLTFLTETGILDASDMNFVGAEASASLTRRETMKLDDLEAILKQLAFYRMVPYQSFKTSVRDDYDNIHRQSPGLFYDVVSMDDIEEAYAKVKRIIKDIVKEQPKLKPMFDIEFSNMGEEYPFIENLLKGIAERIAPQRLFY